MAPFVAVLIGVSILYFLIQFFFTQTIYSNSHFLLLFVLSLLLLAITFLVVKTENKVEAVNIGLILLYYTLILVVIKKSYKALNHFLITKKLLDKAFTGKDFTHVFWDSDIPEMEDIWDRKLALKPSWLDYFLTLALLILPILMVGIIKTLL